MQEENFDSVKSILFYGLLLLPICFGALQVYGMLRQLPRLILTEDGIEYVAVLGSRNFWAWKDVGPFKYEAVSMAKHTSYIMCAFHDLTHDSYERHGRNDRPNIMKADITMDVTAFKGFGTRRLKEIEEEINFWRNEFGSPGNDAERFPFAEIKDRLNKIDDKKNKRTAMLIIVAVLGAPLILISCKLVFS